MTRKRLFPVFIICSVFFISAALYADKPLPANTKKAENGTVISVDADSNTSTVAISIAASADGTGTRMITIPFEPRFFKEGKNSRVKEDPSVMVGNTISYVKNGKTLTNPDGIVVGDAVVVVTRVTYLTAAKIDVKVKVLMGSDAANYNPAKD